MEPDLPPKKIAEPAILSAPSPSIAGEFDRTPLGFVLHGSRSGRNWSEAKEFDATVRFAKGGAGGLGWQATVMSGKVAIHMNPHQWAWHAYDFSKRYIGVEFAQARLGDAISDEAIDAFCWYAVELVRSAWPDIPMFFINHAELPDQGGKTDAFPAGSEADAFKARIHARLP